MKPTIYKKDLLYPEESYKIIGAAFEVYNTLGPGYHEKYYQRALARELSSRNIAFREQVYFPLRYKKDTVGRHYFDFLIDGKIIVELKKGAHFSHKHIKQVHAYIKVSDCKLAILTNFGPKGVLFKRIVHSE